MAEIIDLYDKDQNPLGITHVRGDDLAPGQYALFGLAIITNKQGKYLITQRVASKPWAANWWEVTGGGVRSGETPIQGLKREVFEEVGLTIDNPGDPIYTYTQEAPERNDYYIVNIYHVTLDFDLDDVVLQTTEAQDCALVDWSDIEALGKQGTFLHFERIKRALGK